MRKVMTAVAFLLLTGFIRGVEDRIDRIASEIDSTVGVAALHVESGRRAAVRAGERFPLGSVNKFPIAIAFMREIDTGRRSLSDEVTIHPSEFAPNHSPIRVRANGRPVTITLREAVETMMRDSDNTAAGLLLRLSGGSAGVARVLNQLGLSDIDTDTGTPAAVLALLEKFHARQDGLTRESHELLMSLMADSATGERRIRAGAPAGAIVAHKTGTMPGTVNDVGIITSPDGRQHVLIAVFTKGGRTSTLTQRERAVSTITRAVYREFVRGPLPKRQSTRQ